MPVEGLPVQAWLGALSRVFAPQDLNPLNINPLKELIERFVDFDAIRAAPDLHLFIAATNVETGGLRIFAREEINAEAVMASACLPFLFRAVEIDGVPYWDGGYVGNPVIHPFLTNTAAEDVLVVQINPLTRPKIPTSAREIVDRVSEITFNASLGAELRTIDLVNSLIDSGKLARGTGPGQYRRINLHRIALEEIATNFNAASKLKTDYAFFSTMHKLGERATRRFLDAHFDDIGARSSIDLQAEVGAEWGRTG
jgi:NTE family protein